MQRWRKFLLRVAGGGLLAASFPAVMLQAQQSPASENEPAVEHTRELPDNPGIVLSKLNNPFQPQSNGQQNGVPPSSVASQESQLPQPAVDQPPATQAPQKPVGTATAGTPDASGIAASQPAGVAMAPAKQRRVRTIVLRTGAIIGAGVAVGAVVALTEGTSSRPPGAH